MRVLDLTCKESINFTNDCCYRKEKEFLFLDYYNQIYLYFDVASCLNGKHLKQARLILFNVPGEDCECQNQTNQFYLCPLLDFFSIYSLSYYDLNVDYSRGLVWEDNEYRSNIDIDITNIVQAWIADDIENKGLLLKGYHNSQHMVFAGEEFDIKGMRPMLRLVYEEDPIYKPLSSIPCTVEI